MLDEIKLPGMEALLEHRTSTSAVFTLLGPDDGHGSPVVGSLDLHFPCEDRGFLCATLAIDDSFPFSTTPRDFAAILFSQLQLPSDTLWDLRLWRTQTGQTDNNDPRVFRR